MVTSRSRTAKPGVTKPARSKSGAAKPRAAALRVAAVKPRTSTVRMAAAAPKTDTDRADLADLVVAGIGAANAAGGDENASGDQDSTPDQTDPDDALFKKKHLVDRVVALSGVKKRVAKDVVEATLSVLGDALGEGRTLNTPPLGKLTVNRQKDIASGEVLIVKLRRNNAVRKPVANPLADHSEDG